MPTHSSPSPPSHALLPSLSPTLSLPTSLSFSLFRRPSLPLTLELRGPVLLLSAPVSSSAGPFLRVLPLSLRSNPTARGPRVASLSAPRTRFVFASTPLRDRFLAAARAAIAAEARRAPHRYQVRRVLARGASAAVYLVRRREDGRVFAMKAISKADVFLSDARLRYLVAERVALAEAAERRSAFIVRLVDAFETAEHLCFVTELAAFGDLGAVVRSMPEGRLGEGVVKGMFAEIVLGLEESHRMGYLYRDMKLGNLLLTRTGHVRLADLGLAKRVEMKHEGGADSGSDVTSSSEEEEEEMFRLVGRTSSLVGTRRYMSPEHLQKGADEEREYGAAADVWAMGVSLYMLLTGEYPFGREVSSRDCTGMFNAITREEIRYPEWLSEDAVGMLRGMLERDATVRMGLKEVKTHAWLEEVDWEQVRIEAVRDAAREDVLEVLREGGVRAVESGLKESDESDEGGTKGELFSALSGSSSGGVRRRRKGGMESFNLLGFGYSSSEKED